MRMIMCRAKPSGAAAGFIEIMNCDRQSQAQAQIWWSLLPRAFTRHELLLRSSWIKCPPILISLDQVFNHEITIQMKPTFIFIFFLKNCPSDSFALNMWVTTKDQEGGRAKAPNSQNQPTSQCAFILRTTPLLEVLSQRRYLPSRVWHFNRTVVIEFQKGGGTLHRRHLLHWGRNLQKLDWG